MSATADCGTSTRFAFGANWRSFLRILNDDRIREAEVSLQQMLDARSLQGKRFLDIGCGSGLFSLAARRLGAEVTSFDFDLQSVQCAEELKRRFCPGDPSWLITRASVLDASYMEALRTFDIVYSWGVLHHTGAMWQALDRACRAVAPGGRLFIAIYNDQGARSAWWARVKRVYNSLPRPARVAYLLVFAAALECAAVAVALARLQPRRIVNRWTCYHSVRGMNRWHDLVDWIGGYPFEVATPEKVFDFCRARGFSLERLKTCGGRMGCNEFVLVRTA
jgi:2-polyprenyl-6-hydroxyphenyl methylase/3-demethylubiquinone-9 3-methyltransferase